MIMWDWDETVSEFKQQFDSRTVRRPTDWYENPNFITPEVLGFVRAEDGTVAEISTGTGFEHERIWGVTFKDDNDRSKCCHSMEEVEEALK